VFGNSPARTLSKALAKLRLSGTNGGRKDCRETDTGETVT
jgi:hypothetical protein